MLFVEPLQHLPLQHLSLRPLTINLCSCQVNLRLSFPIRMPNLVDLQPLPNCHHLLLGATVSLACLRVVFKTLSRCQQHHAFGSPSPLAAHPPMISGPQIAWGLVIALRHRRGSSHHLHGSSIIITGVKSGNFPKSASCKYTAYQR